MMAAMPKIETAAPPIAMPAIALGLRSGLDEVEEIGGFALAVAEDVGETVVGVKATV
jgi:hypothetical protein